MTEHVGPQQHLVRAALERREVELRRRQVHATVIEPLDVAARDEQVASADDRTQADDRWQRLALAEPDDDVIHAAETLVCAVEQRATDQR